MGWLGMGNRAFVALFTWVAARILAICMVFGTSYAPVRIELQVTLAWSDWLAKGSIPPGDWWQHPPGFALLLAGLGSLGIGMRGLVGIILLADASIFLMLRDARARMFWALAPILVGPLMIARLDVVVTAFAVAGLLATSPALSAVLLGFGSALKIWPGALLIARPGRLGLRSLVALGTYSIAGLSAWLWTGRESLSAGPYTRGLQVESLAAWPFLVAKSLGVPVPITFRNGAHEIQTSLADRVAGVLPWLAVAGVVVFTLIWLRNPAPSLTGGRSLVLLGWLLLTSRVLSPQYNIWVIGLVAVMIVHGRASRSLVGATAATALAAHILFPFCYGNLLEGNPVGLAVQTVRLMALIGVVWMAGQGCVGRQMAKPDGAHAAIRAHGRP